MQPQHLRPHPCVTPDQSRDPEHGPHRGNAAVLTPQQHFKLLTRKEATINNNKFSSGSATSLHTKAWLAPRNFLVLPEFKPPTYRTKRPSWGGGGGGGEVVPMGSQQLGHKTPGDMPVWLEEVSQATSPR